MWYQCFIMYKININSFKSKCHLICTCQRLWKCLFYFVIIYQLLTTVLVCFIVGESSMHKFSKIRKKKCLFSSLTILSLNILTYTSFRSKKMLEMLLVFVSFVHMLNNSCSEIKLLLSHCPWILSNYCRKFPKKLIILKRYCKCCENAKSKLIFS